jgi:nucleotide-binding universal stress UspA family protein
MIKRILVPVDFSDTSLHALDYAIEFGKPFKAALTVLFVVEPVYYATPADLYGPAADLGALLEEQRRIGKEQLARLAADLKKRRVPAQTVLQTGTAYQVITDAARKVKADLIVLGTHGRTGFTHLLLGSVAERVVRTAPCPVITVRGKNSGKRRKAAKR